MACRMLCPQLHISLQHASQPVLRRMGRGHYTAEMLQRAVGRLHAHWPVMGLGADIIAGFPGEREEDVACLLDFVRETPFSAIHVDNMARLARRPSAMPTSSPIPVAPALPPTALTATCPSRSSRSGPPASAPPWKNAVRLSGRHSWPCRACCWPPTAPLPTRPLPAVAKPSRASMNSMCPASCPPGPIPVANCWPYVPCPSRTRGCWWSRWRTRSRCSGARGGALPSRRCRCPKPCRACPQGTQDSGSSGQRLLRLHPLKIPRDTGDGCRKELAKSSDS